MGEGERVDKEMEMIRKGVKKGKREKKGGGLDK